LENPMSVYQGEWSTQEEMLADFKIGPEALQDARVLLAIYDVEGYEGTAFVLFLKTIDGEDKLFEVNGSHCSCYGLGEEDYSGGTKSQWQPEEVSLDALWTRIEKGDGFYRDRIKDAVCVALLIPH
jgi:hypothetical protein